MSMCVCGISANGVTQHCGRCPCCRPTGPYTPTVGGQQRKGCPLSMLMYLLMILGIWLVS